MQAATRKLGGEPEAVRVYARISTHELLSDPTMSAPKMSRMSGIIHGHDRPALIAGMFSVHLGNIQYGKPCGCSG